MSVTFVPLLGFWSMVCFAATVATGFAWLGLGRKTPAKLRVGFALSAAGFLVIGSTFFVTQEAADLDRKAQYEKELERARQPVVYQVQPS